MLNKLRTEKLKLAARGAFGGQCRCLCQRKLSVCVETTGPITDVSGCVEEPVNEMHVRDFYLPVHIHDNGLHKDS